MYVRRPFQVPFIWQGTRETRRLTPSYGGRERRLRAKYFGQERNIAQLPHPSIQEVPVRNFQLVAGGQITSCVYKYISRRRPLVFLPH